MAWRILMTWRSDRKLRKFGLILAASIMLVNLMVVNVHRTSAQLRPAEIPSRAIISPSLIVTPTTPRLGDTLSVVVLSRTQQAPVVQITSKAGTKIYPAYNLGNNRWRSLIPTTPLTTPGTLKIQAQIGEFVLNPKTVSLQGRSFPTQRIWLPSGQDGNVSDWEFDQVDAFKKTVSSEKLWNGPFRRPNDGDISTTYGIRRYYNGVFADDYFHRGVDYAGDEGSAIVAPAAGRVVFMGYEKDGFKVHGNVIGLDHGQGVLSIFLHMSSIRVKRGDRIQAGQTIGTLGDTGAATGPHLHWGLYVNGECVDPVAWRETGLD